jgi:hypothetical protein
LIDRRTGKRFPADWPVRVEGRYGGGGRFKRAGVLKNISSGGAMLRLDNRIAEGMRLEVFILLPSKAKKWMKYSAHVVRVEEGRVGSCAAVEFEGARPEFRVT